MQESLLSISSLTKDVTKVYLLNQVFLSKEINDSLEKVIRSIGSVEAENMINPLYVKDCLENVATAHLVAVDKMRKYLEK